MEVNDFEILLIHVMLYLQHVKKLVWNVLINERKKIKMNKIIRMKNGIIHHNQDVRIFHLITSPWVWKGLSATLSSGR